MVVVAVGPAGVEVDVAVAVVGEVGGEEGVDLGFDFFFGGLAAEEGPGAPAHVGFLGEFGGGGLSGRGERQKEGQGEQIAHGPNDSS